MNASAANRRDAKPKVNFVDSFFDSDDGAEVSVQASNCQDQQKMIQEQIQESVNAVMINPGNCSKIGIGKDGKLLCRFLAGEKATCTFKHPQSDMSLKGTGVSCETLSVLPKSFKKKTSPSGKVHSVQEIDVEDDENSDNDQ